MNNRATLLIGAIYFGGALLTFGHFYRQTGRELGVRQLLYTGIWPIYWLVSIGLRNCIDQLWDTLWGSDARSICSASFGVFTAGYFLSANWSSCSGFVDCTGVAMRAAALYVPPVWLVYWSWLSFG